MESAQEHTSPELDMTASGRIDEFRHRVNQLSAQHGSGGARHIPLWLQILRAMAERGITEAHLARTAGLSTCAIRSATTDGILPKISTLTQIAHAMNCDIRIELVPFGRVPELAAENRRTSTERAEAEA